jgi:2-keto-4-pentenoate hydratase/2-oxohepta-3-ene-1,7-dioic acid hydratase in catechol pathway
MKVARIRDSKVKETYGIISDDSKSIVTKAEIQQQTGIPVPPNIKDFMFRGWLDEVRQHKSKLKYSHKVTDVELLAPIPNPPKIICLAFNYFDHARDAGLTPSDEPVIFMKPRTALNEPFKDVICPSFVTRLDYEAELAVIIGKETKKVEEEKALDNVT